MYMLILSNGPYTTPRTYRTPMSKDTAKRTAADLRRRLGCSVQVVPYQED